MHILHLVSTMRPEAGGPAEAVRMLLENQPPGYTSEVVTLDSPSEKNDFHNLGPISTTFGYTPKLAPWLTTNRQRFAGVMVHGLWQYPGLATLRAIAGRVPYVVFTHGMLDPYFKRRFPLKHLKKWPYWLLSEYWLLRRAHRVLFTTAAERDLAGQSFWLHRWKSLVVPLGTEPPPPVNAEAREAFLRLCPGVRGCAFLLYLGRIDPKKGCDLLLEAFSARGGDDPHLHLVMAGPDATGWRTRLESIAAQAGIADRVHWPGMVQGDAKLGAFDLCEAFVLPSHQENFGIAVVEALASGRPVLLTDKINIAVDISAEGCGYVENDTADGIDTLLMRWFHTSPQERHKMGLQALKTFESRYDMRRNAKAILQAFEPDASAAEAA